MEMMEIMILYHDGWCEQNKIKEPPPVYERYSRPKYGDQSFIMRAVGENVYIPDKSRKYKFAFWPKNKLFSVKPSVKQVK